MPRRCMAAGQPKAGQPAGENCPSATAACRGSASPRYGPAWAPYGSRLCCAARLIRGHPGTASVDDSQRSAADRSRHFPRVRVEQGTLYVSPCPTCCTRDEPDHVPCCGLLLERASAVGDGQVSDRFDANATGRCLSQICPRSWFTSYDETARRVRGPPLVWQPDDEQLGSFNNISLQQRGGAGRSKQSACMVEALDHGLYQEGKESSSRDGCLSLPYSTAVLSTIPARKRYCMALPPKMDTPPIRKHPSHIVL